jgi:hypothetical protein
MKREIIWAFVAGLAVCWWINSGGSQPNPQPEQDRPVLRWIARAAKSFLWIALVAERSPVEQPYMVHAKIGDDGHTVLDHSQGW